jgi:hypothetical protein
MKSIVGYTGFVGSNLVQQTDFDGLFNSQNVASAYGTKPDLLIYSGVRAEKYLANNEPEKDLSAIEEAIANIVEINPASIILISTVDVYPEPRLVDEDTEIDINDLKPYGFNRLCLEKWVESHIDNHLVVRLPALYGRNLKKNFIYDLITIIPAILSEQLFINLSEKIKDLPDYYLDQNNGFYKCRGDLTPEEKEGLKKRFLTSGFRVENFTDSRSHFQFYNLAYLWQHLEMALAYKIKKLNLATEPVGAAELYKEVRGQDFSNRLNHVLAVYDVRTRYDHLFGGKGGYIFNKSFVLDDLKKFIVKTGEAEVL